MEWLLLFFKLCNWEIECLQAIGRNATLITSPWATSFIIRYQPIKTYHELRTADQLSAACRSRSVEQQHKKVELRLHSKTLGHMDDLIAVQWDAPGSRYDGIEHWMSRSLLDNVSEGKVAVGGHAGPRGNLGEATW